MHGPHLHSFCHITWLMCSSQEGSLTLLKHQLVNTRVQFYKGLSDSFIIITVKIITEYD